MNPSGLTNGTTNELIYPANYPAQMQVAAMSSAERQALTVRLEELNGLPREEWEAHGATELSPRLPGSYMVLFGEDGIAWVVPQPDGRLRLDGLGSQRALASYEQEVEEGGAE